jgi:hypothetical protein
MIKHLVAAFAFALATLCFPPPARAQLSSPPHAPG